MISAFNLEKTYYDDGVETQALRNITFEIKEGEFVAIMGPSGSGKSTLLHILSFMDRQSGGSYAFSGEDINDFSDADLAHIRNSEMGFVFQSFNLLSRSTVYENVEMPLLYNHSILRGKRKEMVERAVFAVGLPEKLYVEAGKLSGGQKQRVAIARALVNNPNVIFADEPTGNLDSHSGAQVMEILEQLNQSGHTIILVTHETYTAEFADRIIKLLDGEIDSDIRVERKRRTKEDFFK
ncbi:MAG: ABC transporter ATP-binding protein [Candidatus Jorgensenbacteria bacterium]|nr:ABC transporter ATP-binding protein [Candidatus Jorgensenbacteria bacterium]